MNSIEAYIQFERGMITEDGQVTDETTQELLIFRLDDDGKIVEHWDAATESRAVGQPEHDVLRPYRSGIELIAGSPSRSSRAGPPAWRCHQ